MIEFKEFPKIPRLNRDMIVTEKIDGTNGAVVILDADSALGNTRPPVGSLVSVGLTDTGARFWSVVGDNLPGVLVQIGDGREFVVAAQSRKRIISPGKQTDNAGFAVWVRDNAQGLAETLGEGYAYGEWWNAQNARKALEPGEQKLSLFNVSRWRDADLSAVPGLGVVPTLYEGRFDQVVIQDMIEDLRDNGSQAHPGVKAEGVVVFLCASGHTYKVLVEGDELPKGVTTKMERDVDGNLNIPKKEN